MKQFRFGVLLVVAALAVLAGAISGCSKPAEETPPPAATTAPAPAASAPPGEVKPQVQGIERPGGPK